MDDTGVVSATETTLPDRTGQRLNRLRDRLTQEVSHTHVLGLLTLLIGVVIVALALVPGALNPGLWPIAALTTSIGLVTILGLWVIFYPERGLEPLRWGATLSPVLWLVMWLAIDGAVHLISVMLLVYSAALCAATCGPRRTSINALLCLICLWVWVSRTTDATEFVMMRFLGNGFTLLSVPVGIYLVRRRAQTLRDEVQRRSVSDPLTGLPNRRHLEVVAPRLVAQAERQQREIFSLTIDADRLATVNEVHGHVMGDEVIRDVAQVLRKALRPEDILVHTTGAQFIALGLSRNEFEAIRVAERIRQAVRKKSRQVPMTCSIGVASARVSPELDPGEWVWNLNSVSEESLAAAKASGRDRVSGARQNGQVLGDALELVTAPADPDRLPPTVRTTNGRRFSPTRDITAYLLAAILVLGVAAQLWFMLVGRAGGFGQVRLLLMGAATIVLGSIAGALMMSPALLTRVGALTIFTGDTMWALGGAGSTPDGFASPLYGVLMAGIAAFVMTRPLLITHMVVAYPLLWFVYYDSSHSVGSLIAKSLADGTLLNLASIALYLVRLETDNLIARSQATTTIDQLTGLPDRHYLRLQSAAVVAGALRHRLPVSVIFVDIDDFGEVNDRVGHHAADEALLAVTRAVNRVTPSDHFVMRFGGDDLVIIGNHGPMEAFTTSGRVRDAVSTVWVDGEPLTASIGVVSARPMPGTDPARWMMTQVEEATDAMRRARVEGGGRVVTAQEVIVQ